MKIPTPIRSVGAPHSLTPAMHQPPARRVEPVLLIHGTFANIEGDPPVDWWHPGSDFCRDIDAALAEADSAARCWSGFEVPFAWSGANSESERRMAGRALAASVAALEDNPSVARYHLVAHSHGGNVVLNAMRDLAEPPRKLGAVVFMGTPVLNFHHRVEFDPRWIAVPLYVALIAAGVLLFQRAGDSQVPVGAAIFAIAIALVMELLRRGRTRRRSQLNFYGSGHAHAFRFDGDEAINGLVMSFEAAAKPRGFVEQFIAPEKAGRAAFAPSASPRPGFFERMKFTGAYTAFQYLGSDSTFKPLLGASREDEREDPPAVAAPAQALLQTAKAATGIPALHFVMMAVLWICAALPLLAIGLVALLRTSIVGAVSWSIGRIVFPGAKWTAARVLPWLVRRATFGADDGRFVSVNPLPPGVRERESMSAGLLAEVEDVGNSFAAGAGGALMKAIAGGDALALKARVGEALRDRTLVHSYYYRSPIVRRRIAELIAWPSGVGGTALAKLGLAATVHAGRHVGLPDRGSGR